LWLLRQRARGAERRKGLSEGKSANQQREQRQSRSHDRSLLKAATGEGCRARGTDREASRFELLERGVEKTPGRRAIPWRPECRKLGVRDKLQAGQIADVEGDERQIDDRNAGNPNDWWKDA